jgi:protein-S-isoprenylcysteine O-methyltransferase Ste14
VRGFRSGAIGGFQFAWRGWILGMPFLALAWVRHGSHRELAPAWLLLAASGAAYRLYAGGYIAGHSNSSRMGGEELAISGPYLLGRHPLYLANVVTAAGLILFANCLPLWGAGLLFAWVCAHHASLAIAEERFLAEAHGEPYLRYLRATSRWLGLPRRYPAANGAPIHTGPIPGALRRQGGNLGKTAAAALILWALAGIHP